MEEKFKDKMCKEFFELNKEAAEELINTYLYQDKNHDLNFPKGLKNTSLVFPYNRGNIKLRISEQEYRFVITSLLEKKKIPRLHYAVEVPTKGKYKFSGQVERSASTDMVIYKDNKQLLNIEFKAHNPKKESINKDIEKLIGEGKPGAWCHLLKNIDGGTLDSLFGKILRAINKFNFLSEKTLLFSFIVLEKRLLITRKCSAGRDFKSYLDSFEKEGLHINYSKLKSFIDQNSEKLTEINDWNIERF